MLERMPGTIGPDSTKTKLSCETFLLRAGRRNATFEDARLDVRSANNTQVRCEEYSTRD
jgi:hypothetical protein